VTYSSYTGILLLIARGFLHINPTYPQKTFFHKCFWSFKEYWPLCAIGQQSPPHIVIVGNGSCRVGCQLSCSLYHSTCVIVLILFYSCLSLISRMVLIVFTIYIYQKVGIEICDPWKSPVLKINKSSKNALFYLNTALCE